MKTVLITGAGRGLGKSVGELYHQAGFFVVATDINPDLFSDISEKENYLFLQLDVSSEESVKQCLKTISTKIDRIDVLISNAGIFDFYPVSESGSEKLLKIFRVNVLGLVNLTKWFLPLLEKSKGRLIVISSESYKVPSPFQPYSVSKQSLESVFKAVKIELSQKGISSILIRPGAIQTKILEDTVNFKDFDSNSRFVDEFKNFVESVPKFIGKVSTTNDVAELILKAGISKRPKPVYSINHNPLVTLLSLLPTRMKGYFISKSIK